MAKIIVRGSQCSLLGVDQPILTQLEEKYSYDVQGHEYSEKFESNEWNGKRYVFRDRHFNVGLLEPVLDDLKLVGIEPDIDDRRQLGERKNFTPNQDLVKLLRHYQRQIAIDCIQHKSSSIEVVTSGGKTWIAAQIIAETGLKTLFLCSSIEVLKQTRDSLTSYLNEDVGMIGNQQRNARHVTVATWQSLKNESYNDYLGSIDLLIIDEAQHVGPNVLKEIAKRIPAIYRLGMSGTLWREDGADLEIIATCGKQIAKVSYSDLTEQGFIVPAEIRITRFRKQSYPDWWTYADIFKQHIVQNPKRNEEILKTANELLLQGRKVLIFTTRIEHGMILADLSNQQFVFSTNPNRDELTSSFKKGDIQCLISTSLLNEGFDAPIIDAVVFAAPQKSLIATLQKIGRSLRLYEGKNNAIVVDTADNVKYLWKGFQRRLDYYRTERAWKITQVKDVTLAEEKHDIWGNPV